MEDTEKLRETIICMRRKIDSLRTENLHSQLLLSALDAVLCTSSEGDPRGAKRSRVRRCRSALGCNAKPHSVSGLPTRVAVITSCKGLRDRT